ncbi:MAG TPA: response regulator [Longimicrobiaceae bacterium]|jgi:CheY-like chemotaxis protein|nr:response regulator [Longimicrobiaceae bacterium]
MDRKTILVVDDSESICDALACLLEIEGHATLTAPNGEEGVSMARRHRPDLVLLDIMMPVLDGWGAVRQLKAGAETAHIPVLALTALRLSQAQLDEAGFDGYLSKPIPSHRLLEEIRRACSQAA